MTRVICFECKAENKEAENYIAALEARGTCDLEMMKADILSHKWLEEQNEKMKVVLDLIASEGCQREGVWTGAYNLRCCSSTNPDRPDMWCYHCMAKKALEEK